MIKVLAIIPARGGSKRIKNKNIKNFLGKEIIRYPINALLSSDFVEEVFVSTDSLDIKEVALAAGATVPFLRSEGTSNDYATTFDVIREVAEQYHDIEKYDYIACVYPTSVFVTKEIFENALIKLNQSNSSGIVTLLEFSHPIQRCLKIDDECKIDIVNPENYNARSQDLDVRFHDAGQLYIFKLNSALEDCKLITTNSLAYVLPQNKAQDIDTEDDWAVAEAKYKVMMEREE